MQEIKLSIDGARVGNSFSFKYSLHMIFFLETEFGCGLSLERLGQKVSTIANSSSQIQRKDVGIRWTD